MKRNGLVYFAAIVAAGVAVLWFLHTFERATVEVWVGPSGEARTNPYLAAQRFMQRLGVEASLIGRNPELASLPPGATLILPIGRSSLTAERIGAITRWVREGGHLIVEPEPTERRDAILEAFRIGRSTPPGGKLPEAFQVELPSADQPLRVTAASRTALDVTQRDRPDVQAEAGGSTWFASWTEGMGRITVLGGVARFRNGAIGKLDNADFLRRTWELSPGTRRVLVWRPIQSPPLWEWITQYALGPLTAGAILTALWLTRTATRFGPVRPAPQRERRRLLEHIRACGRFRWAQGARASLLDAAREICRRRMLTLEPRLAHMTRAQRDRALAASTGIVDDEIARAFDAAPHSTREFVHIVATLASIHGALGRTGRTQRLGRRIR